MKLPSHLQARFDSLSEAQKQKFYQLLQWSNPSGLKGISIPVTDAAVEGCLKMVEQMGAEPVTPTEPDRTVNHDWPFKHK